MTIAASSIVANLGSDLVAGDLESTFPVPDVNEHVVLRANGQDVLEVWRKRLPHKFKFQFVTCMQVKSEVPLILCPRCKTDSITRDASEQLSWTPASAGFLLVLQDSGRIFKNLLRCSNQTSCLERHSSIGSRARNS